MDVNVRSNNNPVNNISVVNSGLINAFDKVAKTE